eukprot:5682794-Amphidinium_carterae.1
MDLKYIHVSETSISRAWRRVLPYWGSIWPGMGWLDVRQTSLSREQRSLRTQTNLVACTQVMAN